uniref:(2Fe-2S) ferredoxin n=1 Tax=Candidatus Kentrum sp. FW TaxID=2126338 RepID=A0A450TKA2_9GAMM|nr:MAG: (2Fe-2S) ferredoxin [Candidatus Kentron sp. FW]
MPKPKKHVFICAQSRPTDDPKGSCVDKGCQEVLTEFQQEFQARELWGKFAVATSSCLGTCYVAESSGLGPCYFGPSVLVYPDNVMYGKVKKSDVKTIIEQHLLEDTPVTDLQVPADVW